MSFTTAEDVALALNVDITDLLPIELSIISSLIVQVDGVINSYCGLNLTATDYSEKRYNGTGTSSLDVRLYPINTLSEAKIRNTDGTFTDITAGLEWFEDGVISFLPNAATDVTTFTAGTRNVYLTFNAGYEEGSMPPELRYTATQIVVLNFYKIMDQNTGLKEEKFKDISFNNEPLELNVLVRRVLDRYRLVSIF